MTGQHVADRCPKCGSLMKGGVCTECNYSEETSLTHEEARELTTAG